MQRWFRYMHRALVCWIGLALAFVGLTLAGCDVFRGTDELISEEAKAAAYIPLAPLDDLAEENVHSDVSVESQLLETKQGALESKTARIRAEASTQSNATTLKARIEALEAESARIRREAEAEN